MSRRYLFDLNADPPPCDENDVCAGGSGNPSGNFCYSEGSSSSVPLKTLLPDLNTEIHGHGELKGSDSKEAEMVDSRVAITHDPKNPYLYGADKGKTHVPKNGSSQSSVRRGDERITLKKGMRFNTKDEVEEIAKRLCASVYRPYQVKESNQKTWAAKCGHCSWHLRATLRYHGRWEITKCFPQHFCPVDDDAILSIVRDMVKQDPRVTPWKIVTQIHKDLAYPPPFGKACRALAQAVKMEFGSRKPLCRTSDIYGSHSGVELRDNY